MPYSAGLVHRRDSRQRVLTLTPSVHRLPPE